MRLRNGLKLHELILYARDKYARNEVKQLIDTLPIDALDILDTAPWPDENTYGAALNLLDTCTPNGAAFGTWVIGGTQVSPGKWEYTYDTPKFEILGVMLIAANRARAQEDSLDNRDTERD